MKILLVAGHGAGDPGAIGNGFQEHALARELAQKLQKILNNYADVSLFDINKNMYAYLKSGNTFDFSPYDYILEIHFNAASPTGVGTEILVHTKQNGISVEECILNNMTQLGFKNRGIKRRSNLYNMNYLFNKGKDYALLETCFITSNDDMNKYAADQVAEKIASGIIEGFGLKMKQPAQPQELTSVNDIVWELANRGIITDKKLWLDKLQNDTNAYWLARKTVAYIGRESI